VQLEEELNVKVISDQEYNLRRQVGNLKNKLDQHKNE